MSIRRMVIFSKTGNCEKFSGDKITTEELKKITINQEKKFYTKLVKINPQLISTVFITCIP